MIRDDRDCSFIRAKTNLELQHDRYRYVSSSSDIESFIDKPDVYSITFVLVACNYIEDVKRCLNSVIRHTTDGLAEFIVIDNCSTDGTGDWVEHQKELDDRIKLIRTDHVVGEAMVKNIGFKQARGEMVIILDTSVELTGDIVAITRDLLKNEAVGLVGAWGLKSNDLKHFHEEVTDGESDAMQAYCIALRRNILSHVGLMRESFRFYRNLDIDYSFQVKNRGYSIFADKRFPLIRHDHRQWNALEEEEREKLSRINFKRFFKRWGSRTDLLS
jgi:glycosyltransferase involved in cell wall biosynthesis